MTYQEKYLKYKKKYLELKGGAGFHDLPDVLINEIVSSQRNCKDLIKAVPVNRQTINAINWRNLETRIPTLTTTLNLNNPQSRICALAKPEQIDDCNSYYNRCKLKHLFKKYRPGLALPANFDVNTLNDILVNTVILNNPERDNDIESLIAFGATERGIPNDAFRNRQLREVIIPNFVTSIGDDAFSNNQLTNVTIPDSVTSIGNQAFYFNKLTNVTIPDSVISIGNSAFFNNRLTNIVIPDSVTFINGGAFAFNPLTNVTIPDSVISIGDTAFFNNQLTNIVIPDSVTSIGKQAFAFNPLTNVTIPNSVTSIGNQAFSDNQAFPDNQAFSENQLTNVTIPNRFEPTLKEYFDNLDRITFTYT